MERRPGRSLKGSVESVARLDTKQQTVVVPRVESVLNVVKMGTLQETAQRRRKESTQHHSLGCLLGCYIAKM